MLFLLLMIALPPGAGYVLGRWWGRAEVARGLPQRPTRSEPVQALWRTYERGEQGEALAAQVRQLVEALPPASRGEIDVRLLLALVTKPLVPLHPAPEPLGVHAAVWQRAWIATLTDPAARREAIAEFGRRWPHSWAWAAYAREAGP